MINAPENGRNSEEEAAYDDMDLHIIESKLQNGSSRGAETLPCRPTSSY